MNDVEKVARAIASVPFFPEGAPVPWEKLTARHQAWCLEQANAAVFALRTPAEGVTLAVAKGCCCISDPLTGWQAGIHEILKSGQLV